MQRIYLILPFLFLVASTPPAAAQQPTLMEFAGRPDLSAGMAVVEAEKSAIFNGVPIPGQSTNVVIRTISAGGSWNFPLVAIGDDISFGVSPGAYAVINRSLGDSSVDMSGWSNPRANYVGITALNIPIFATAKYGVDATLDTRKNYGAAVGIGVMPSWFPGTPPFAIAPALMAEIALAGGSQVYKVRFTGTLGSYNVRRDLTVSQYSIHLVMGLGR